MAARLITINVRKYLIAQPETKRRAKAVSFVRERIARSMKSSPGKVRLAVELNEAITKHYSRRMLPIKVSVTSDKDKITATLFSAAQESAPKAEPTKEQPSKAPEKSSANPAKAGKGANSPNDAAKTVEKAAPEAGRQAKGAAAPRGAPETK